MTRECREGPTNTLFNLVLTFNESNLNPIVFVFLTADRLIWQIGEDLWR